MKSKLLALFLLILTCFRSYKAVASENFSHGSAKNQVNNTITKSTSNVPVDICSESQTWVRPSAAQQREYLQTMQSRYSAEQIAQLGGEYWTHNIFSFTSYPGGSGTFDINNLSGLWTLKETTHPVKCDDFASIEVKNKASVWLLFYRLVNIKWDGRRYVMVVKPRQKGVQVIHFVRREHQSELPLTVVTETGKTVELLRN